MSVLKPGQRLKSAVCDTEVIVVRNGGGADISVECGGAPMDAERPAELGSPKADLAGGSGIGKRYVNADGSLELLCVKAGKGSLSANGVALQPKEAKPLPSSD